MIKDTKNLIIAMTLLVCFTMLFSACGGTKNNIRTDSTTVSSSQNILDTLYFGTRKAKGTVTKKDWENFLKGVVTPRFPDGLTAWEGYGQWKGKEGKIIREKSHILQLVHPAGSGPEKSILDIIEIYKKRFNQESVMRVKSQPNVSF